MARYLVGKDNGMWKLTAAIMNAASGDIIEMQDGYSTEVGTISIEKNLTIVGRVKPNGNGGTTFENVITGSIHIINGANVTLQNIWLQCNTEKNNMLNCKEGSKVQVINTVFENTLTQGENYPIIYMQTGAEVTLEKVTVLENKARTLRIYMDNATATMDKCVFRNSRIYLGKAELTLRETTVSTNDANAIDAEQSKLTMEATQIYGSDGSKDYPAVWNAGSSIVAKRCTIQQPQYEAAVLIKDSGYFEDEGSSITSVKLTGGRTVLRNTVIRECLQVRQKSYAYVEGNLDLLGENDKKVHVYVDDGAVVQGDRFTFSQIVNPNVRVTDSSLVEMREVVYKQGSVSELIMENDATSRLHTPGKAAQEQAQQGQPTQNQPAQNQPIQEQVPAQTKARRQLEEMIGLKSVKAEIEKMLRMVEFNQQRVAKGLEPLEQSYHSVFMGNPGTGKTTVARLIGEVLFESGAFKSEEFKLIEASEPDFISENVGGTAQQTIKLLEKAKGGVLFIDEAYALNKKGANVNFGIEAINTILKYMEDHRGEIMIIFAGYTKEMEQFLKTNPGLTSRIPNKFVFEDYTPDEIVEIGVTDLQEKQYKFEDVEYYKQQVKRAYKNSLDHSNARWIRNFNEKLVKTFATRAMNTGAADIETICRIDLDNVLAQSKYKNLGETGVDAMERLTKLIGIPTVKEQVTQFVALAEFNMRREEQGQETGDFTLHSMFLGNPGTGKTTVARIVGEILYQKGVIADKKFIEVSRSDLVAGYLGQTALKTREVLESALGGVLFIDEAYSLTQGHHNEFGIEAVNEILKFMEDHRKDIVIILAGYTKEMGEFVNANSGLTSRIPHIFDFEDYTQDEIVQIGLLNLHSNDYQVDEALYGDVVKRCYAVSDDHSNGRWVRNLNEKLIMLMSKRVTSSENADVSLILEEDLHRLEEFYGQM